MSEIPWVSATGTGYRCWPRQRPSIRGKGNAAISTVAELVASGKVPRQQAKGIRDQGPKRAGDSGLVKGKGQGWCKGAGSVLFIVSTKNQSSSVIRLCSESPSFFNIGIVLLVASVQQSTFGFHPILYQSPSNSQGIGVLNTQLAVSSGVVLSSAAVDTAASSNVVSSSATDKAAASSGVVSFLQAFEQQRRALSSGSGCAVMVFVSSSARSVNCRGVVGSGFIWSLAGVRVVVSVWGESGSSILFLYQNPSDIKRIGVGSSTARKIAVSSGFFNVWRGLPRYLLVLVLFLRWQFKPKVHRIWQGVRSKRHKMHRVLGKRPQASGYSSSYKLEASSQAAVVQATVLGSGVVKKGLLETSSFDRVRESLAGFDGWQRGQCEVLGCWSKGRGFRESMGSRVKVTSMSESSFRSGYTVLRRKRGSGVCRRLVGKEGKGVGFIVVSTADNENEGRALGFRVCRVARMRLSGSAILWQPVGATGEDSSVVQSGVQSPSERRLPGLGGQVCQSEKLPRLGQSACTALPIFATREMIVLTRVHLSDHGACNGQLIEVSGWGVKSYYLGSESQSRFQVAASS
ncbi:hypothetical protein B0F90DRAFT_1671404 [Multifurca ochricompacta]|uniref:Uncharacterized protein n=1 Tax=Multifurca ochricompacta TaxID=376703 RepID=A0AAD4LXQ0_9AGAM|nr:hypothetical protein B0F90DRAFT_1671404 [Multifurca ochricompacta]